MTRERRAASDVRLRFVTASVALFAIVGAFAVYSIPATRQCLDETICWAIDCHFEEYGPWTRPDWTLPVAAAIAACGMVVSSVMLFVSRHTAANRT